MGLEAVLFDLYGTVVFLENPLGGRVVSEFLVSRGFEVYPQALDAAWHYVGFIDYPRYGFDLKQQLLHPLRSLCMRKH